MTDQMPPMPKEPTLSFTGYVTRDGKSEIVTVRRDDLDDWMVYARDLAARLAASQALAGDLAEALSRIRLLLDYAGKGPIGEAKAIAGKSLTRYQDATR